MAIIFGQLIGSSHLAILSQTHLFSPFLEICDSIARVSDSFCDMDVCNVLSGGACGQPSPNRSCMQISVVSASNAFAIGIMRDDGYLRRLL